MVMVSMISLRFIIYKKSFPSSDAVHGVEDVLVHYADVHSELGADAFKIVGEGSEIAGHSGDVRKHYHDKQILKNGLRDINDVNFALCACRAYFSENTDGVLADNGYNGFHFLYRLSFKIFLCFGAGGSERRSLKFYHIRESFASALNYCLHSS